MIVVNAIMKTNDNNFETVKEAVKELELKTRNEKGCLDYAFSVELYNDKSIRITELWEDLPKGVTLSIDPDPLQL